MLKLRARCGHVRGRRGGKHKVRGEEREDGERREDEGGTEKEIPKPKGGASQIFRCGKFLDNTRRPPRIDTLFVIFSDYFA